jgi:diaminopimelate decarboxylase
MDHFQYRGGNLFAEDVDLREIADTVGTPVYVYSSATLKRHYHVFKEAFEGLDALICFAVKANSNQAVLTTLAKEGSGADVVSGGELTRALRAGISASKIVFSGVGKTPDEMRLALEAGIKQFNVESEAELEVLNAVAQSAGLTAPVSVRVNPDVDAKTHAKISTGKAENKFGIPWVRVSRVYNRIAELSHLKAVGVDVHIGSQLTDLEPFEAAFKKVVELVKKLRTQGHDIQHIDLGGGLGIPYDPEAETPPSPGAYGAMINNVLGDLDCSIILEPGRLIAGNAGILLTSMLYEKESENKVFYILDAAMNDLSRPAMYDAYHDILPVKQPSDIGGEHSNKLLADFVGPVCETGDTFAKSRPTAPMSSGDLAVIKSAGAYGAVMASTYNSRMLIPEVLVHEDQFSVIRKRQTLEDLIKMDQIPHWLAEE